MDNPPGRYLPANFNIFDFFFGSQSTPSLMYSSNQNLKNQDTKSSMNIDNSGFKSETMVNNIINVNNKKNLAETSKDTSDKSSPDTKKNNTRIAGMLGGVIGALTNVIAKITNFTSTINKSLTATATPPETFPTEYVVRPLTDDQNFTTTDDSTLISTSRYRNCVKTSETIEASNNLSPQRISEVDISNTNNYMWSDNTHDYYYHNQINNSLLYSQHASDIQLAIEENFKVNKEHCKPIVPESIRFMENSQLNSQYIQGMALAMEESLKTFKMNYKPSDFGILRSETNFQNKIMEASDSNTLSKLNNTLEFDDYVDFSAEQMFERRSCLPKKRSKFNNKNRVAQSLGKNRRRVPLRRSTAGQMKHRKEKSKNVIYSAIQNDLNTWEDKNIDSSDMLCSIISSSDQDENTYDQKKCSLNFQNYAIIEKCALGDPPVDNVDIEDTIDERWSESINHSKNFLPPPRNSDKFKDCLVSNRDEDKEKSESEVETESESKSESESTSNESTVSESEFESSSESEREDEDDSEEDDSRDTCDDFSDDDFIQFEEEIPSSTNSKVRFNLQPTVHTIIKWDFAYRAARKGPWEQMARDRDRFRIRIFTIGRVIEPVLANEHRDCIWKDRFAATD